MVCALPGDVRGALEELVAFLGKRGVAAVLLDCFGYGETTRKFLRESLGSR